MALPLSLTYEGEARSLGLGLSLFILPSWPFSRSVCLLACAIHSSLVFLVVLLSILCLFSVCFAWRGAWFHVLLPFSLRTYTSSFIHAQSLPQFSNHLVTKLNMLCPRVYITPDIFTHGWYQYTELSYANSPVTVTSSPSCSQFNSILLTDIYLFSFQPVQGYSVLIMGSIL